MIDINKAKDTFKSFLNNYKEQNIPGFQLKVDHIYYVIDISKEIALKLNLSDEDINLAQLIALLHDIGRFEEISVLNTFDDTNFDHASYGVKMLFESLLKMISMIK